MTRLPSALIILLMMITLFPSQLLASLDWNEALDRAENSIVIKVEVVDSMEKRLPAEMEKVQKDLMLLTSKLELILWSRDTDIDNPLDLNDMIRSLDDFQSASSELAAPFNDDTADLKLYCKVLNAQIKRLENAESWAKEEANPDLTPKIDKTRKRIVALAEKVQNLQSILSARLEDISYFNKRLENLLDEFEKLYIPALTKFYVEPSSSLTSTKGLESIVDSTQSWLDRLAFKNMDSVAMMPIDWTVLIVLFLGLTFIIMRLVQLLLHNLDVWDKPGEIKHITGQIGAWIGSGLAMLVAVSTMNFSPSAFFRALAAVLLGRGLVLLARSLKGKMELSSQSLLFHNLWIAFAIGSLFQGLLIPEDLLSIIMALTLGLCGLTYYLRSRVESGFAKTLCLAIAWPWFGFAFLSLFGWGNIAVGFSDLLFSIYLNVTIGVRIMFALNRLEMDETDSTNLARKMLLAFSFPALLVALTILIMVMTLAPLGGFSLFKVLIFKDIELAGSSFTFARIIAIIGLFFMARSLAMFTRIFIAEQPGKTDFPLGIVHSLQTISSYIIWAAYIMFSLSLAGISTKSLTVVAGGLSVGIGFGMQHIINNFISGLILLFGRSVQPGDIVDVGKGLGCVERVTIRNTVLTTFDGTTLFVPNSALISSTFVNWTNKDYKSRITLNVNVPNDSDTSLVSTLLLKVISEQPEVLKMPLPQVRFKNVGKSSLEFELNFWVADELAHHISSDLRSAINAEFRKNDIETSFPQ